MTMPTFTIAKRELASYFNSPLAYVVICLSQVLLGVAVFLLSKYWQVDRATLVPLFNYAPFGLGWLIIPVVTMRLIAEEKSSGTLEMLITLPVKDWEVIIGKYLGALALVLILIASTLLYPLVMFWFWKLGPVDMGPVWSGYLGLTLMSAAGVAIGLLVSSLTKSQVISFFVTFVVLFALVTLDQVGDIASSPKLGAVIQYVSFHSHVQNFARGLIDTRSILYFVSLTAFSLIVAFRALESRKWRLPMAMERKARAATESGIYLLIVAGIVIAANVLGFLAHRRFDVTKTERFTLSKGSGRLVRELKRPITLKAYISNTGLAKIDAFTRDLDDLMREYERAGAGKFVYQKINPRSDAEKQEAKDYGLKEVTAAEGSETGEDQASIAQGYMGLVFLYGNEKDVLPVLSPDSTQGLEFWISNKIREVRDKADDVSRHVGLLTGKDEIKLADTNLVASEGGGRGAPSMRTVVENAFPYYKFEDVDLKGGETEIDGNLDALIITQPGKDFTDKELRRIDQFLMKDNKALVVYASAINMKEGDAHMGATLSTHGLEKLLAGYGVEMKKDALLDLARPVRLQTMTQSGQLLNFRHPAIIDVQVTPGFDDEHQMLDASFIPFLRMDEIVFPFASSLELHKEKQPDATSKIVARTSQQAYADATATQDLGLKQQWVPKPPLGQHAIAIAIEGTIKSAFGGGDAEGVKIEAQSKTKNRVLVVSSAQFLASPLARQGNGQQMQGQMGMMMPVGGDRGLQMLSQSYAQKYLTATILSFRNTLDWATGDPDLVATSAKILGEANLSYADVQRVKLEASDDEASLKRKDEEYKNQRKKVQTNVQLVLILFAPILFAGFGLLRWQLRERRRAEMKLLGSTNDHGTHYPKPDHRRARPPRCARRRRLPRPEGSENRGDEARGRGGVGQPAGDEASGGRRRKDHQDPAQERGQGRGRPREDGRRLAREKTGRLPREPGQREDAPRQPQRGQRQGAHRPGDRVVCRVRRRRREGSPRHRVQRQRQGGRSVLRQVGRTRADGAQGRPGRRLRGQRLLGVPLHARNEELARHHDREVRGRESRPRRHRKREREVRLHEGRRRVDGQAQGRQDRALRRREDQRHAPRLQSAQRGRLRGRQIGRRHRARQAGGEDPRHDEGGRPGSPHGRKDRVGREPVRAEGRHAASLHDFVVVGGLGGREGRQVPEGRREERGRQGQEGRQEEGRQEEVKLRNRPCWLGVVSSSLR